MDGDLGFYTIKPDQMQVINPLLILVFIPLYEVIFYPLLNLIGIRRPLQKITLGGILAGVAFLCSMIVEINLEKTYTVLPQAGEAQIRIFNGQNCEYAINSNFPTSQELKLLENSHFVDQYVALKANTEFFPYTLTTTSPNCGSAAGIFILKSETATSYFITGDAVAPTVQSYEEDPEKSRKGTPLVRVLANTLNDAEIILRDKDDVQFIQTMGWHTTERNLTDVPANLYVVEVNGKVIKNDVSFRLGGVYTVVVHERTTGNFVRISKIFNRI